MSDASNNGKPSSKTEIISAMGRPKVVLVNPKNAVRKIGYEPTEFAHYKRSILSFESVCYNAIALYLLSDKNNGSLPAGAKTSYAKDILLHHPDHSLKTTRNLVSISWKLQNHYSWLFKMYFEKMGDTAQFKKEVGIMLAKILEEALGNAGYERNHGAIDSFLSGKFK